jgi:hypothetical protein
MTIRFGVEGKLYYCAAGIGGTPAWVLYKGVKNVTNPNSLKEVDVTTRANAGYEATDGRIKQTHVEFEAPLDPADPNYIAFETAYINNSIIGVADMTGASGDVDTATPPTMGSASRGLWADCKVTQFDREETIEGAMIIKITCKPTYSVNAPIYKIMP